METQTVLSKEALFLESKIISGYSAWAQREVEYRSQSSNISRLSNDVFSFDEYNFLPSCESDILDGHYTLYVNYKTFQYLLYKSSDYGGLTYTLPVEFKGFLSANDLPESSKQHIESIIAHKLLTAYFYDYNHINHYGANLIYSGEPYSDTAWGKGCLISDNRGYMWCGTKVEQYSDIDLSALKILCGFEQPAIDEFSKEYIISIAKKFTNKKGIEQRVEIELNGKQYIIVHLIKEVYGKNSGLIDVSTNKLISYEILDHKLKDFIKAIPTILKNIAE